MAEIEWPTVAELADAGASGRNASAVEVVDQALAAIEAGNDALNAFVVVDAELARRAAADVDAAVARGEDPGPLAGVPFGVKDLEDCAGLPTSHGSLLFKGGPPAEEDSVQVGRMRAAGAVPLGKTAAPEFGTLNFTKTKAWGITRNPWDLARTPGGSSGGSAAAVGAGLVPIATASDGGGSTRIPAGFTGLVGLKAGYGRIPNIGASGSQTAVERGADDDRRRRRPPPRRGGRTGPAGPHLAARARGLLRARHRGAGHGRRPGPLVARPRVRHRRPGGRAS